MLNDESGVLCRVEVGHSSKVESEEEQEHVAEDVCDRARRNQHRSDTSGGGPRRLTKRGRDHGRDELRVIAELVESSL